MGHVQNEKTIFFGRNNKGRLSACRQSLFICPGYEFVSIFCNVFCQKRVENSFQCFLDDHG